MSVVLRGMTWDHTRGIVPLQAAAQRFNELHPDIQITWDKRSLKGFEEFPIARLAEHYDLMVIDHPFIGEAAEHRLFCPLDDLLPADFLADQARHTVGKSYESYTWDGHQWALAIDAATPVMAWRPDLLNRHRLAVPSSWQEIMQHARAGLVEIPGEAVNCLMNFYATCIAQGGMPFADHDKVIDPETGQAALAMLAELHHATGNDSLHRNPIASLEYLASAGCQKVFCLFPYGYSNYSREGYADHVLIFGDLPSADGIAPMTTTLGGTGLAISSRSRSVRQAAEFAAFAASSGIQRTLYTDAGGQPGHRSAWTDAINNRRTHDYFTNTLPALDRAFLRPRYDGHLHGFQSPASDVIQNHILRKIDAREALRQLDRLYQHSQTGRS